MNIVVLCGGLSPERDVSITSGTMAAASLRRRGHKVVLIDLFFGYPHRYERPEDIFSSVYDEGIASVSETEPDLEAVRASRKQAGSSRMGDNVIEVCRASDIVFLALHGQDGEDGKIQATFDLSGIRYTGSGFLGSALAMNKAVSKQLFRQNGIKTPEGFTLKRGDSPPQEVPLPCIVKPCSGGSSVGASVVESPESLRAALELGFKYDSELVIEQYIRGRECSVGVLAGRALPVIELRPKEGFYDYRNKYQKGRTDEFCPADFPPDITAKLQRASERVFDVLKLDVYARMDFIVDESGEIWCLEANTLPGLTPLSLLPQEAEAAGMSYDDLCEFIVRESLKKYEVQA